MAQTPGRPFSAAATAAAWRKASGRPSAAEQRLLKKELAKVERQIEKAKLKIASLLVEQEQSAFEAAKLLEIADEIATLQQQLATHEQNWLEVTLALEP
jgi:ATP-binding cassette subfamily F protein uup